MLGVNWEISFTQYWYLTKFFSKYWHLTISSCGKERHLWRGRDGRWFMFLDPLLILGSYSFVTKIIPFTHIMQWYDISSVKNSLRLETCRGLFKLIVLLELENSTKAKSKRIYCCSFWLYPKWHFLKTDLNENSQDTIVEKLKWIEELLTIGCWQTMILLWYLPSSWVYGQCSSTSFGTESVQNLHTG